MKRNAARGLLVVKSDPNMRGQVHGPRLKDAREAFAAESGAFAATRGTHGFQAPDFHTKPGYTAFGQLADYPPGYAKLFLCAQLGGLKR